MTIWGNAQFMQRLLLRYNDFDEILVCCPRSLFFFMIGKIPSERGCHGRVAWRFQELYSVLREFARSRIMGVSRHFILAVSGVMNVLRFSLDVCLLQTLW